MKQYIDFGTVEFAGKTYKLINQADFSDTCFPSGSNFQDVGEGETYLFEMVARAVDDEGNEYEVSWVFSAIKGEERELDEYDYSVADDIRPL